MALSRRTAVDVPRAETLHLPSLFSGQPLCDSPVTSARAQTEGTLEAKSEAERDPSFTIPACLLKTS